MCPNQFVDQSLLPDCHISNRVFMYSLLHSLQAEERRIEEVDVQLRDRYDIFRQVLPNYPLPMQNQTNNVNVIELPGFHSSTSMENNASSSEVDSLSGFSLVSNDSNSSSSSGQRLSARCDYFEDAVRCTLAELRVSHEEEESCSSD